MSIQINTDQIEKIISAEIQSAVVNAAEPLIQEHLKKCELEIRQKVAAIAMTYAQNHYEIYNDRNVIQIRIGLDKN